MSIEPDGLISARTEAAELSVLLGLSNYTYTEGSVPTFTGVFAGRKITVKKKLASKMPPLSSPRSELQAAAKKVTKDIAAPKSGQELVLGWVISSVRSTAPPVPNAKRRVMLEEAVMNIITRPVPDFSLFDLSGAPVNIAKASVGGQEYLLAQISAGNLVSSSNLAKSWGITSQALGNRKRTGFVFGMKVNNQLWYPAALKTFQTREVAEGVCSALRTATPIQGILLLSKQHAELGFRSIAEALAEGMAADVQAFLQSATGSASAHSNSGDPT